MGMGDGGYTKSYTPGVWGWVVTAGRELVSGIAKVLRAAPMAWKIWAISRDSGDDSKRYQERPSKLRQRRQRDEGPHARGVEALRVAVDEMVALYKKDRKALPTGQRVAGIRLRRC